MDDVMSFKIGEKLSALRTQKGVTQENVADALGISNKTVSKWETGLSLPEAEYIPALADYFDVSIDEIFGRAARRSAEDVISGEYRDLSPAESVQKVFSLAREVIWHSVHKIGASSSSEKIMPAHILAENMCRVTASGYIGYEILINSPDTNLALMLFQNERDFAWIDENAKDFVHLFRLLADTDGIKMVRLMYTRDFPSNSTADYVAKRAGISEEKARELLELSVLAKVCTKREANLQSGKVDLYQCLCDGMVLAILNLAFEYICGKQNNEYYIGGKACMIGGETK